MLFKNYNAGLLLVSFILLEFLFACTPDDTVRFAFLTDLHVVPSNDHEVVLQEAVKEINAGGFDFVVITGDLSNMGSDAELQAVKKCIDAFEIPCYMLPGNHETNWSETGGATYQELFGDDRFYFEYGKHIFIGFNTGPYMKMGDGHVKREDVNWLQDKLQQTGNKTVISMAHYPIADGLDNWHEVSRVLRDNNVRFALCGHGHRLRLMNFNGVTGLMGRALIGRNKDDKGYNIVKLSNDSVWVEEKKLGQQANLYRAWNINETTQIDSLPLPVLPSMELNKTYVNVKVEEVYADDASVMGGFGYNDNTLTWVSSNGVLKVYDNIHKQMLWQEDLGKPQYSTPLLYEGLVITGTSQGVIKAYSVSSGDEVWQTEVGAPVFAEGIIEDGNLYIGCGKAGFYKIDANTGQVVWHFKQSGGFVQANPCVGENEIVFGAWDRHLYCLDKQSGQLRWKWNNGHGAILYSPGNVVPAIAHGKVFIVAPDRYFTVLDIKDGSVLYRSNEHKVRESMGMSSDKQMVFAKLMNDSIVAYSTLRPENGSLWSLNVGFGYEHNPCPLVESGGVVYGGTKNGELFAVDARKKQLLWRHKISNSSVNKLLVDDDTCLWVNSMDGRFVRVKLK